MYQNVQADFDPQSLLLLNGILALMIFGVSMSLRVADFYRVLRYPRAPVVGLVCQFLLLPALTTAVTWGLAINAELALGMLLVACCPGGTFSNIMTFIARGNVAVSVSMTAVSSLAAVVLTPLNFALYGAINPVTQPLLQSIALDSEKIALLFVFVLGLPLIAGMWVGAHYERFAQRFEVVFRRFSLIALLVFVVLAVAKNLDQLLEYVATLIVLVAGHNALALLLGFAVARLVKLPARDTRAVTLEVGIQNAGLALSILFTFFSDQGGMLLIAAFWGMWHLVSGSLLSYWWAARPVPEEEELNDGREILE